MYIDRNFVASYHIAVTKSIFMALLYIIGRQMISLSTHTLPSRYSRSTPQMVRKVNVIFVSY